MDQNRPTYMPETLAGLQREELRHLLTAELEKEPVEIDDSLVRLLLRELENRGKDTVFTDDEAVEAACEKFRLDAGKDRKPRRHWYQSWLVKAASVVMVLGILFFSLPRAAQAENIQDVLTWWSDSVFQFFKPGEQLTTPAYEYKTDHPGLQQIYDAVTALGVTEQVVPRSLSREFELRELKAYQMAGEHSIVAHLASEDKNILFTVVLHTEEVALQHEKDKQQIEIWEMAGNEHYIVSNNNERIVTWITNGIECTVTTDCAEEDAYKIIKSIYTSEG